MNQERIMPPEATARRTQRWSRRDLLKTGAVVGAAGAIALPAIVQRVEAASPSTMMNEKKRR